ncbi:hypothetical protein FLJ32955, isoform CRA_a [Homo sapiens]|uniref:cDNA FLJ32955 fis, clone TESTI2008144 n=1 Tax=Homo sapiens TaxID=9606 RepID=Q96LZ6_HUMAN|nr:hypothetical protein FLJ32955, isoform CRA_a [Homo sapiens]EAX11531.1 hypothetical protein FLJ32955, isoform CRA_a [Homo sapiens]BAB71518.1 unnamed protein product [Homo sapiens]
MKPRPISLVPESLADSCISINLLSQMFSSDLSSYPSFSKSLLATLLASCYTLQSSSSQSPDFFLKVAYYIYISLLLNIPQLFPSGHRIKSSFLACYLGSFSASPHKFLTHLAEAPSFQYSPKCCGTSVYAGF